MNKAGCYVRVSTENQLENYSIEEQMDRLRAFCKAKDLTIAKIYTDGGYSGGNTNRPALQQMLSDIGKRQIDTVVVYKLDRLSRSQKDTLMLIEDTFLANEVNFISVNENFDTSTAFGRAMIGILSVFAQLEKDQITERFTMGRIGRAKTGFYHGGPTAPTGYDYTDGRLIVNEYEAMQVQELYERFAKGYSLYNCWQYMRQNYTTKYGAWKSEALICNVLRNEVYIGKVKFAGETYAGKHHPIIEEELFQKVQHIFDQKRAGGHTPGKTPFKASTLLSGLIYCGKCGAKYHGEHGNYSCYSRTKGDKKYIVDPDCKNKKWRIPELDQLVINCICKFDFADLKTQTMPKRNVPDYTKRISEIEAQILKLIDLYQINSIPVEVISEKINALSAEKEAFINHSVPKISSESSEDFISPQNRFIEILTSGSLEEKRSCLGILVNKIVVQDENINIFLNKI